MDKMTFHRKNGRMWLKECDEYEGCDGECWYCESGLIDKIMERLAQYEELGVSPEQIKALIDGKRPETGGTPMKCPVCSVEKIALANIQPIGEANREEAKKESDKGGHQMIIRMKGEPKELAEFAKAMQLPVVGFGCDLEETTEAETETVDDTQRDLEQLAAAAKAVTGEDTQRRTIPVELHWMDLAELRAEANKRGMTGCELAEQIINNWLDEQKKKRT